MNFFRLILLTFVCTIGNITFAQQPTDCTNAIIVCGNSEVNLDVNGIGSQELSGSNTCSSQENNSLWLEVNLVSNGTLGFTLTPGSTSITEDYDFFIFGPNVSCGNIGQAIRCSTTNPAAANQGNNLTGMNSSETDVSEGPGPDGNSFVQWLDVQAGETYFIVIDRPIGNSDFSLEWTGSAQFPTPPTNAEGNDTSVLNLDICDVRLPFNDGISTFDLNLNTTAILGGQTDTIISYHESESDANIDTNPIVGPYINTSNPQTIFVRLTNTITGCFEVTQFDLNVNLGPDIIDPTNIEICDNTEDGNATNGFTFFDLTLRNEEILNGLDALDFNITYHPSLNDAEMSLNALPNLFYNTMPNMQRVFVRVEDAINTNCFTTALLDLRVLPIPNASNTLLFQCDEDGNPDGFTIFNLNEAIEDLTLNEPDRSTKYYTSFVDAQNSQNEVDGASFNNWQNPQIIYVQVVDDNSQCFNIVELTLEVSATGSNDAELTFCDDDGTEDGFYNFDLSVADAEVLFGLPAGLTTSYYETYQEALTEENPLNNNFTNTVAYNQLLYVRVENMNDCYGISELQLTVNELPDIEIEDQAYYCLNEFPFTITLDAGLINDDPNNYTYNWSTSESTYEIQINEPGAYSVTVRNIYGCTKDRNIVVEASNIATIEAIDVNDGNQYNTITILTSGEGIYEYALFNEFGMYAPYQSSTIFTNVIPDIYTIYIRDIKNNCGVIEETISVIGFPQFFTPNNDGHNDRWIVKGISSQFQPNTKILIFDRSGKLLKELNPLGEGWDGTFNGNPLPVSDYWFSVTLQDGRTFMDHFTLKR